jgi:hypothetical protein
VVDKLKQDPKFMKKSKEALGGYPLYSGEGIEDEVQKAFEIPPQAREYALKMLEQKYGESISGT